MNACEGSILVSSGWTEGTSGKEAWWSEDFFFVFI